MSKLARNKAALTDEPAWARTFLQRVQHADFFRGQIADVEDLPARAAQYKDVPGGLAPQVKAALVRNGIDRLYAHQADAIARVRAGKNVVVVTGTASGKTLCYNIPIVEALLDEAPATALLLYPTKALAQDQLRGLGRFQADPDRPDSGGAPFLAGTYDGDTPGNLRRRLRDGAQVILTNPDMLHTGILPNHGRWSRFFTHLRFVVIDEVHAYRGVFGSHLANVVRRLRRICRHYGAEPQFLCSSATIANPAEHAGRICGASVELVDNDGSPRGARRFVLWNPPPLDTAARGAVARPDAADRAREAGGPPAWRTGGDRRSPIWESIHLTSALVAEGIQTITFARTRLATELIFRSCRELLRPLGRRLADSVHAYRGGYLPAQRRDIERRLVSKDILGVASTNALELGIDIGSLQACVLCGYPGTIASLWQRAGRAGRGREESLVFLVAQNAPIDQYLMANSAYLFAQNPEQAVVDPDNPHVAVGHIQCAVHELPLADAEVEAFGPYAAAVLDLLAEDEFVRHIDEHWYWASTAYPAADVNLRNIAGPVYTIQDAAAGERVIGTLDEVSALSQLHDHAVYLHAAETYFVTELDVDQKIAHVERRDLDYYTQAVQTADIRIDEADAEAAREAPAPAGAELGFGDVTVTTNIPMFKKVRFGTRESLGFEQIDLPPQTLETVAMWLAPRDELVAQLRRRKLQIGEALIGIGNVLVEVAGLFVMADPQDIGAVVDSSCLGRDALFLHDRYPGGMGYARRCLGRIGEILAAALQVIRQCPCPDGCPSCVGAALPAFALTDLDSGVRERIPDKQAARLLLERMLPEPQPPARSAHGEHG